MDRSFANESAGAGHTDIKSSIILLHAPAGMGKTRFLQSVADQWPGTVWIDGRVPDSVDRWLEQGRATGPTAACPIVLDEPERLHETLRGLLLDRVLPCATAAAPVLIATRQQSALPIARWVASERVQCVGVGRLLLTRVDVDRLCARRLSRVQAARLHELGCGWPAATLLLLRWLETGGTIDVAGAWLHQSGMADYLEQELFAGLPDRLRTTLTLAGLCEGHAAGMIETLDPELPLARDLATLAAALPGLVTLDDGVCRLHPILRAEAAAALTAVPRAEREAWLLRGADWLADHGELLAAARLAKRAGQRERIAEYIRAAGGLLLWMNGQIELVGELVALVGETLIDGDVRLRLLRCVQLLKEGRVTQAERLFASACADLPDDPAARREALVVRSGFAVYGCRLDWAVDLGSIEEIDSASAWGCMWPTLRLVACSQDARFDRARAELQEARAQSYASGSTYNLVFLDIHEASLELACGDLTAARTAIDRARRRWRRRFPQDRGLETVISATAAQLEFESGRTTAARNQLRIAQGRLPDAEAWLDIYVASYEPRMRLIAADNGLAVALSTIETTCRTLTVRGLGRIATLLRALATMLAGERHLADAAVVVPLPPEATARIDTLATWQEREFLWLARAYHDLAAGRIGAAIACLEQLRDHAQDRQLHRTEQRALLVLTAACDRAGRSAEADATFDQAVAIGIRTGLRRAFVEFGGGAVMQRLAASGDTAFAAAAIRGARPSATAERTRVTGEDNAPVLSPREREVLQALRAGGSDKVVARRIGLSEHGVRFHLKKLFLRFGVHDRVALLAATG